MFDTLYSTSSLLMASPVPSRSTLMMRMVLLALFFTEFMQAFMTYKLWKNAKAPDVNKQREFILEGFVVRFSGRIPLIHPRQNEVVLYRRCHLSGGRPAFAALSYCELQSMVLHELRISPRVLGARISPHLRPQLSRLATPVPTTDTATGVS